jgi:hypothetical protein
MFRLGTGGAANDEVLRGMTLLSALPLSSVLAVGIGPFPALIDNSTCGSMEQGLSTSTALSPPALVTTVLCVSPGDSISAFSLTCPADIKPLPRWLMLGVSIIPRGISSLDILELSNFFHSTELAAETCRL